jgi:hypothetical protein
MFAALSVRKGSFVAIVAVGRSVDSKIGFSNVRNLHVFPSLIVRIEVLAQENIRL